MEKNGEPEAFFTILEKIFPKNNNMKNGWLSLVTIKTCLSVRIWRRETTEDASVNTF